MEKRRGCYVVESRSKYVVCLKHSIEKRYCNTVVLVSFTNLGTISQCLAITRVSHFLFYLFSLICNKSLHMKRAEKPGLNKTKLKNPMVDGPGDAPAPGYIINLNKHVSKISSKAITE